MATIAVADRANPVRGAPAAADRGRVDLVRESRRATASRTAVMGNRGTALRDRRATVNASPTVATVSPPETASRIAVMANREIAPRATASVNRGHETVNQVETASRIAVMANREIAPLATVNVSRGRVMVVLLMVNASRIAVTESLPETVSRIAVMASPESVSPGRNAMVTGRVPRVAPVQHAMVNASPGRVTVSREIVPRVTAIASRGTRTGTGQIPRGALAPNAVALTVLDVITTSTR